MKTVYVLMWMLAWVVAIAATYAWFEDALAQAPVGGAPTCVWQQECEWVTDANGWRHVVCHRVPVCPR